LSASEESTKPAITSPILAWPPVLTWAFWNVLGIACGVLSALVIFVPESLGNPTKGTDGPLVDYRGWIATTLLIALAIPWLVVAVRRAYTYSTLRKESTLLESQASIDRTNIEELRVKLEQEQSTRQETENTLNEQRKANGELRRTVNELGVTSRHVSEQLTVCLKLLNYLDRYEVNTVLKSGDEYFLEFRIRDQIYPEAGNTFIVLDESTGEALGRFEAVRPSFNESGYLAREVAIIDGVWWAGMRKHARSRTRATTRAVAVRLPNEE
jgi:hypothetical protein